MTPRWPVLSSHCEGTRDCCAFGPGLSRRFLHRYLHRRDAGKRPVHPPRYPKLTTVAKQLAAVPVALCRAASSALS
ncbi:MAG: hypothetical protein ACLUI3_10600 [Christensenellales bacterium]